MVANENASVARSAIAALRNLDLDAKTVVDAFNKVLDRDEQAVVIHAVEAMIERGAAAVPVINEILKNDRTALWGCVAIESIGPEASEALPGLMDLLGRTDDTLIRMNGFLAVASIGPAARSAGPQIAALFDQLTDPTEQAAAIYALGSIGYDDAESRVAVAIAADNQLLAAIGAWAEAKMHPDDDAKIDLAVSRLTQALRSDDAQLRTAAARALAELNLPVEKVAPALIAVANDPDPAVVDNVVDALASRGSKVAGRAGKALANPELKNVALAVLERLGTNGSDALPDMVAALAREQGPFRAKLQLTLAGFGPQAAAAAPELILSLESPDEDVRTSAMYALGCMGPAASDAAPMIEKKFSETAGFEKLAAAWSLIMIEPGNADYARYAVKHLPDGLHNPDSGIRLECVKALGSLGAAGKPVLEALRTVANEDDDDVVREAATQAIEQITSGR